MPSILLWVFCITSETLQHVGRGKEIGEKELFSQPSVILMDLLLRFTALIFHDFTPAMIAAGQDSIMILA